MKNSFTLFVCFTVAFTTCASLPLQNDAKLQETPNSQQSQAEPIKQTPKSKRGLFGAALVSHAPLVAPATTVYAAHAPIIQAAPLVTPAVKVATSYSNVAIRHVSSAPILHAAPISTAITLPLASAIHAPISAPLLHAPLATYHAPLASYHAPLAAYHAPLASYHAPIVSAYHAPLLSSAIHF